jgi:hypothetical protein
MRSLLLPRRSIRFLFEGNMKTLTCRFQFDDNEEWKMAYIEVKATTRPKKVLFLLSDRQSQMIDIVNDSKLRFCAQMLYRTDELYLIVNVYNVLSKQIYQVLSMTQSDFLMIDECCSKQ